MRRDRWLPRRQRYGLLWRNPPGRSAGCRGELSQAESKLAVARAELARLQEQVALLEPTAQKYEELKDRVATVELDAHRKAQATVDGGPGPGGSHEGGGQQWISGILGQYDQLRQAVDELDRRLQAVGSLAAE